MSEKETVALWMKANGAVCEIYGIADGSEAHANACLIAAAPEVLQSLRAVIQYLDAPGDGCFSDVRLAQARAAIAKATGGSA